MGKISSIQDGSRRKNRPTAKQLRAAFKGTVRMFAAAFKAASR